MCVLQRAVCQNCTKTDEADVSSSNILQFSPKDADRLQAEEDDPVPSSQPTVTSRTLSNIFSKLKRLNYIVTQLPELWRIFLDNASNCVYDAVQGLMSAPVPYVLVRDLGVAADETFVHCLMAQLRELQKCIETSSLFSETIQQTSCSDSGHEESSSLPPLRGDLSAVATNGDVTEFAVLPQQHSPSSRIPDDTQQLADDTLVRSDVAAVACLYTNCQEALCVGTVDQALTTVSEERPSAIVQPSVTQVESKVFEFAAPGSASP